MQDKGCGIICEYNPFHLGHKYQLEKASELFDFTVCLMSGDFVQRGEAAFQKKEVRAANASKNGADIVLEMPFPYSSFGAEGFAQKGVEILTASGLCSHLLFGSECGDVEILYEIAEFLCREDFFDAVINEQKKEGNLSFARARKRVVSKSLGEELGKVLDNPNDILGVEYIKAIIKTKSPLKAVALKRSTPRGGYDEVFASSSYIRENFFDSEKNSFIKSRVPEDYDFSQIFANCGDFYKVMLVNLSMKAPWELEEMLEVPKGYGYLIAGSAAKAKSFDELCSMLCGKTMTMSKVKRMLLFCFFGIKKERYHEQPLYTRVLSFTEKGRKMLKSYSDCRKIIIASRIKDIKQNEAAYENYCQERIALEVLYKCITEE